MDIIDPNFTTRVKIALLVLFGKSSGRVGPRTECNVFQHEDGSPSYHQAMWRLELDSPEAICMGLVPKLGAFPPEVIQPYHPQDLSPPVESGEKGNIEEIRRMT